MAHAEGPAQRRRQKCRQPRQVGCRPVADLHAAVAEHDHDDRHEYEAGDITDRPTEGQPECLESHAQEA